MNRIKILFFIPTLNNGGAENVLINLVNNMNSDLFEITLQTLFDKDSKKESLSQNVRYKSFLNNPIMGISKILSHISARVLYRVIIKEKYDIVVSYLQGVTAHILSGCPFSETQRIVWIHTAIDTQRRFRSGFKSIKTAIREYKSFDQIVFVAKTVKERFDKVSGISFDKGIVIYNTIETDVIREKSKESFSDVVFSGKEINVVSTGKLIEAKGYDRLIRIHKRLIDCGLKHHIYVLGTGPQKSKLERLIQENRVNDSFTLLGFRDNPYKYVAKANLFVCSSRREGLSTAVTESLIVGTPVVSTSCSGANELLGDNCEYGLVTENNENSLFLGLKKMISDEELLAYYKKRALERGKDFNKSKTVNSVEKMIINLFQGKE